MEVIHELLARSHLESGKSIKKAIKEMLRAWFGTHFFELLVDVFLWVINTPTLNTELSSKIERSRDPPKAKIFTPIPKLESNGGCARSDLLLLAYF